MTAMEKIAKGLNIMLRAGGGCEMVAEHDVVWASDGKLKLSAGDRAELKRLGWFVDDDIGTWSHFV